MTTVSDVSRWMEQFAPLTLAEPWDNVGLLWGDPAGPVERLMTCLTVTPDSADEAISERATLIVTHHPILFRPVQKVTADRSEGAMLWRLARAGVAVYSPHTAFDNAPDGINAGLARRFGLVEVAGLRPSKGRDEFKVIVFAPAADRDAILEAAFAAGAGRIGDYEQCSFTTAGRGTFFGSEGTHPTVGQAGRREQVREWKIEVVSPPQALAPVLAAIREAHSYEEPAIDVVPLHAKPGGPGVGRVGTLPAPISLAAFAARVRSALACGPVQMVGDPDRRIGRVAIGCGAGDDFVDHAARVGADVLVTGEARFHRILEAAARGLGLILAGHYATERPGVEDLAERLGHAFPGLAVWPSRREHDPIQAVSTTERR
jgi:dinuclear metal center YbgI/SA1388 family protein